MQFEKKVFKTTDKNGWPIVTFTSKDANLEIEHISKIVLKISFLIPSKSLLKERVS